MTIVAETFLLEPIGLSFWIVVAFAVTVAVLVKVGYPKMKEQVKDRQAAIRATVDDADRLRAEADELLTEYRERLKEAREQGDDILARARTAADRHEHDSEARAKQRADELLARARRDIEVETRLALERIRKRVAELTVTAVGRVSRDALTDEDHRRLIREAVDEVDFSVLRHGAGAGANGNGNGKGPQS